MALFSKQFSGDEINKAFAPAGPLDNQETTASVYDVTDSLFLAIAEGGIVETRTNTEELKRACVVVRHEVSAMILQELKKLWLVSCSKEMAGLLTI